ncbi:uncharacterized protein BDR25DRAFT_302966 [Lindgomyces ingoldianus]|uniref:Uncharacterized protein n=1 Tax=Lindgomyces ingoldianus TaxID=673940 RepID=A0ACB6R1L5_9PLEO|nr:uncharacterized protein BDR25DRAFT_302966 [Lindgomyces ingoldianus]KAF2472220.1 hypothetical protein BDR25DRAFT_302966 [Lindgomyces ingoldianus]
MRFLSTLLVMLGAISVASAGITSANCGANYMKSHVDDYTGFTYAIQEMPKDQTFCVPAKSWKSLFCDSRTSSSVWAENTSDKEWCFSRYTVSIWAENLIDACTTTLKTNWISAYAQLDQGPWWIEVGRPQSQKC